MIILLPAILKPITGRMDKSVTLKFETRELKGEEVAILFNKTGIEGWLAFKENEILESEMPKEPAETGMKSQSQRLRGVIFLLWSQRVGGDRDSFNTFYHDRMEKFIQDIKDEMQ